MRFFHTPSPQRGTSGGWPTQVGLSAQEPAGVVGAQQPEPQHAGVHPHAHEVAAAGADVEARPRVAVEQHAPAAARSEQRHRGVADAPRRIDVPILDPVVDDLSAQLGVVEALPEAEQPLAAAEGQPEADLAGVHPGRRPNGNRAHPGRDRLGLDDEGGARCRVGAGQPHPHPPAAGPPRSAGSPPKSSAPSPSRTMSVSSSERRMASRSGSGAVAAASPRCSFPRSWPGGAIAPETAPADAAVNAPATNAATSTSPGPAITRPRAGAGRRRRTAGAGRRRAQRKHRPASATLGARRASISASTAHIALTSPPSIARSEPDP